MQCGDPEQRLRMRGFDREHGLPRRERLGLDRLACGGHGLGELRLLGRGRRRWRYRRGRGIARRSGCRLLAEIEPDDIDDLLAGAPHSERVRHVVVVLAGVDRDDLAIESVAVQVVAT
jgi:hypothetical protein